MRVALLSSSLVAAGVLFACSTFSDASEDPPPPAQDAGRDVVDAGACVPAVFDPSAPSACPDKDLSGDPENCGACGHRCVDKECVSGRCETEKLTDELPPFAVDGAKLYHQVGTDLHVRDLTKRPPASELFFPNVSGTLNRLEVYDGVLYLSASADQTTLRLSDKMPGRSPDYLALNTTIANGLFFPGPKSYYLFDDPGGGQQLARIVGGSVEYKRKPKFTPLARSGAEMFWTETLAAGANVFGPWEQDEKPLAQVGTSLEAFAVEGETVYLVGGGSVLRVNRGTAGVPLATEDGVGVALAVDGSDVYYATRHDGAAGARYALHRVDKCRGGAPVPLYEDTPVIKGIFFIDTTHVMIDTSAGLFRTRR